MHHVDLDLDASTALRFHFGELAVSVPYRAAQVVLLGVDAGALSYWQMFLSLSILFHHSNVRLPHKVESALSWFLVTPRMHGIHHSNEPAEANTNWSSGLACWDRIHRTFRLDVPQEQIHIGVKGIDTEERVRLPEILTQPFRDVPEVTAFLQRARRRLVAGVRHAGFHHTRRAFLQFVLRQRFKMDFVRPVRQAQSSYVGPCAGQERIL